jgi:hypothetical protein
MTTSAPDTESETRSTPSSARRSLFSLLCVIALAAGGMACGGDDDGSTADAGGGSGPDASAGDDGGDDGADGADDGGEADDGADDGSDVDCPLGQPQDPSGLTECCEEFGTAHCVPNDQLAPEATAQLAPCEDGASTCVPDVWIEGNTELVDCDSQVAGPGVCLSQCIPLVADNAELLQQDICADGELCAPCNFPGGGPTGACELDLSCEAGEDPPGEDPPDPPGDPAEACCSDRGVCLSTDIIPDEREAQLQEDSCTEEDQLCVPTELIDQEFEAEPCESTIGALGGNPEGACLFDCLANTGLFLQDGCADGFKCVACEVPILGETGACEFLPGGGN